MTWEVTGGTGQFAGRDRQLHRDGQRPWRFWPATPTAAARSRNTPLLEVDKFVESGTLSVPNWSELLRGERLVLLRAITCV